MTIEIRKAHPDEYAALGAIAVRASRALGGFPDDHPYYDRLADVARRATDTETLVAFLDGVIAGVATYVPGPGTSMSEFDDPEAAGIRMLAVDPRLQGRGLGRALTAACLDLARASGKHRVIVHSSQIQRTAQAMYLAVGFRREPALDWAPEPGVYLSGFVYEL
jgi:GNAT superfamily N-acetyltransferase